MLEDIRNERDGKVIEKTQIRSAVNLLIEVGVHSRIIYEQEFEVALLQETADYYRTESNKFITVSACPQYLEKANQRLSQEYDRIQNYLSQSTEQALIQAFLDEYISD